MRTDKEIFACHPAGFYNATPEDGIRLRSNYKVGTKDQIRLTIYIGNAGVSGIPDVRLDDKEIDTCKDSNPFVWIIDEQVLHGKTLRCNTNIPETKGISPSKILSITYTLEGGESPKQWISQVSIDDISDFPVLFEADIYLYSK